jgi:hypothetical protein
MKLFHVTLCVRETFVVEAETEEQALREAESQFDTTGLETTFEEIYEVDEDDE